MSQVPEFDLVKAHRYFSADCFNRAWDLIDKSTRTTEEQQAMLLLTLASLWHWTQRTDATSTNLSVGYWQVSRVYALLGEGEKSRQYGLLSLRESQEEGVAPFYLGYSYEALARAESVAGDEEKVQTYRELAHLASDQISDNGEKKMLLDDLTKI